MARRGEVTISRLDSGIINYDDVFDYIVDLVNRYDFNVKQIAYDPYQSAALIAKLDQAGYPMQTVRQGTLTLNIPTRDFQNKVFDGKIKHGNNRILAYAVNNAIVKVDNNGWQLDKARNSNRIDPIAALIDAYVPAMDYYQEKEQNNAKNEYYAQRFTL